MNSSTYWSWHGLWTLAMLKLDICLNLGGACEESTPKNGCPVPSLFKVFHLAHSLGLSVWAHDRIIWCAIHVPIIMELFAPSRTIRWRRRNGSKLHPTTTWIFTMSIPINQGKFAQREEDRKRNRDWKKIGLMWLWSFSTISTLLRGSRKSSRADCPLEVMRAIRMRSSPLRKSS
jgi:hypothetical protein